MIGSVQQRCNKRLKNVVLQAVEKVRQYGPEDLLKTAQELETRGAHTEFALAKRLLRLCKHLAVTGTIYRPKLLLDPETPKETLAAYYQALWDKLLLKWRDKADLKDVFSAEHPLGQWRNMARDLYALELRLPQQRPIQTRCVYSITGAASVRWSNGDWDRAGLVGYLQSYRGVWQQMLSVQIGNTTQDGSCPFN